MSESATLSATIRALGRFLLSAHLHEARSNVARPWLLRRNVPCPICLEQWAAVGLGTASVERSA